MPSTKLVFNSMPFLVGNVARMHHACEVIIACDELIPDLSFNINAEPVLLQIILEFYCIIKLYTNSTTLAMIKSFCILGSSTLCLLHLNTN